jgi:hypothetical protein
MSWVHWGDVPGWVSAVSTAGAFATGGWLLKRELDEGQRRQQAEAQLEDDRRRQQASSVAAWPDRLEWPEGESGFPPNHRAVVQVHNASTLPVYEASLIFTAEDGVARPWPLGVVPPGLETNDLEVRYLDEHFLSWGTWMRIDGGGTESVPSEGPTVDPYRFTVAITFRDAAGTWWTRNARGQLSEGRHPVSLLEVRGDGPPRLSGQLPPDE